MFFLITMIVVFFCPESILDALYANGLYVVVRWFIDLLNDWLNIPFLYLLVPFLIVLSLRSLYELIKKANSLTGFGLELCFRLLRFLMLVIILFYWLWGVNYKTPGFFEKQAIALHPVDMDHVEQEYLRITDTLNKYSEVIDTSGWEAVNKGVFLEQLRTFLSSNYREMSYRPAVYEIYPKGWMMRIGAQGVYLPWLGQGHIDAGLHDLQKPFTYLHEMSHGFGLTHEGECNFVAYQVGIASADPFVRYSAYISYWRYLAFQMALTGCHDKELMNNTFKEHIYSIYRNSERYPDLFPRFRQRSYDLYLKAQGIEEGMKSYSELIMMQYAWENRMNSAY